MTNSPVFDQRSHSPSTGRRSVAPSCYRERIARPIGSPARVFLRGRDSADAGPSNRDGECLWRDSQRFRPVRHQYPRRTEYLLDALAHGRGPPGPTLLLRVGALSPNVFWVDLDGSTSPPTLAFDRCRSVRIRRTFSLVTSPTNSSRRNRSTFSAFPRHQVVPAGFGTVCRSGTSAVTDRQIHGYLALGGADVFAGTDVTSHQGIFLQHPNLQRTTGFPACDRSEQLSESSASGVTAAGRLWIEGGILV